MSLARNAIIFAVIIVVILLILVFAVPDAWAQCVGVCDSESSTESLDSGSSAVPGIFTTTTATPTTSNTRAISKIVTLPSKEQIKQAEIQKVVQQEQSRKLNAEFARKRQNMTSRPDILAQMAIEKSPEFYQIQEMFQKAENEQKFAKSIVPEGPYGLGEFASRTLYGHKSKEEIQKDMQVRKREILRTLYSSEKKNLVEKS